MNKGENFDKWTFNLISITPWTGKFHFNDLNRKLVMMQQIWKLWWNFMCPLGPFLLAQSHICSQDYHGIQTVVKTLSLCESFYTFWWVSPLCKYEDKNYIHIVGKFGGGKFRKFTPFLSVWRRKVWRINRSAKRLLIYGFSLVNHKQFAKFAKLSPPKLSHYTVCK